MSKIVQFGENVEGYTIPVLNEREIRAAAGMLFMLMFISIQQATQGNFTPLKYAIIVFLTDMLIRVLINPKYSPTLILGRWIVRNQTPEYVGARQKKFAWKIGIALATTMLVLAVIVNSYSPITGLICMVCLVFLFFEAVFGICLGCKFYPLFFKDKVQYCPGEVCDIKSRHDIQKTNWSHLFIVVGFAAFIVLTYFLFNEQFVKPPFDLFGLNA
ncbi:DUF4395 domain-containing protein [Draconibacterium sp. IB214405]|uniref:DUF4395 domain-containing protein n=1 Tax=Draconibacterium sp. IB214405 TaxID=3097352 RepID=UPI002A0F5B27|nr:DUF4395 domain-containing protein [Draconibacterium sp. IB214405]MDX8340359.1 DUF4395 domain-containing protein [Draconibacterium sp. IB214405]